ncbi:MAG: prepilin-type N-terminal cleavage/methylation domain-containing protein [Phycisphaeraceae bacterium]|nr:prepilin-type N-terminal cleavage/methylation domain-containing protein [Phycisphaeraceae bacterium]
MKTLSRKSSTPGSSPPRSDRRTGLTLVEVLGSLVLVATLLAGVLAAQANATRQAATANRRLEAADAADELLTRWWRTVGSKTSSIPQTQPSHTESTAPMTPADPASSFPIESTGKLEQQALRWRTHVIEHPDVEAIGGQVVRLEILDERATDSVRPLITLDVVLPASDDREEEPANTPEREDEPDAGAQAMARSSHSMEGRP